MHYFLMEAPIKSKKPQKKGGTEKVSEGVTALWKSAYNFPIENVLWKKERPTPKT